MQYNLHDYFKNSCKSYALCSLRGHSPIRIVFIPDHNNHKIILLAHAVMNKFKYMKCKKSYMALKINREKAHNRIE